LLGAEETTFASVAAVADKHYIADYKKGNQDSHEDESPAGLVAA
jgi:hypothetical protein